ncbi:MAG TPA: RtcB family protein [Azospira sp.]|nr:RtcB family protein [Azospira sp.]
MDTVKLHQCSEWEWELPKAGAMRVPAILFATAELIRAMDEKVREQLINVASLPGIVEAAYAMPDAHWGYGFPIGGVAAFAAEEGGVISAGGVGFDISCGVRTLHTGLKREQLEKNARKHLADLLYTRIPAGIGSTGGLHLSATSMEAMLRGGAAWAVKEGYGSTADLSRIEALGRVTGADPGAVSEQAKKRQQDEMGTLGSGNHYLEVQVVAELFDAPRARAYGLALGDVVVSIHCGSRGLGHQIGTDYLREMVVAAPALGIFLPDRELACAPLNSPLGQRYLGAMRAAINCAQANRQILTHLARQVFAEVFPGSTLPLLYDVSHNTCKEETHQVAGQSRRLFVHRKGATRAFGPQHAELPPEYASTGQPVLIGGSMGTASYILAGAADASRERAFGSACHGAGRAMSRNEATRRWQGRDVVGDLAARGILVRSPSWRGVAEEAPQAYKDVDAVVNAADQAGLATKIARLEPLICIKG